MMRHKCKRPTTERITVTVSRSLRQRIEEERERGGRSISSEVEARLRRAYEAPVGEELVLLRLDHGLMMWLRAFQTGAGFFGNDIPDSILYLIRHELERLLTHDFYLAAVVPHLPEPIRSANINTPKFQALIRDAGGDLVGRYQPWKKERKALDE